MPYRVSSGTQAVSEARKWLDTPYCWGGGHGGTISVGTCVDCSGLVNQVFGVTGTTLNQVFMGSSVANISDAGPGDLVFFGPIAPGEPHHVGIYVSNGQMIDAPHTGTTVRQEGIAGFGPINAVRRLVPTTGVGSATGGTVGPITFNYAQIEGVWIMAGGNPQAAAMAAAIAMAESGGNSQACGTNSNATVDRGLWQINSSNGAGSSFDVMTNARTAVAMSNNGANWRPWCTAYSDGACGTRGGVYQGSGSPYLKFLRTNVPPDMNVPLNATGAAVSATGTAGTAMDTSFIGNLEGSAICGVMPWFCVSGQNPVTGLIGSAIEGVLRSILNPLIQIVAGVMGIAAGGVMAGFGIYLMMQNTQTGQRLTSAGKAAGSTGLMAIAPESAPLVARTSGERVAARKGQTSMRLMQGRTQQLQQSADARANILAQQSVQRQQEAAVKAQLKMQAAQYAEYLRRSRPPKGAAT